MNFKFLTFIAGFIFILTLVQTATAQKIPAKESSLINHLVKEIQQSVTPSEYRTYLRVTIGKITYIADIKSGKVISQEKIEYFTSGGFSGAYAEVQTNIMNVDKLETAQGAGELLKLTGKKWKRIALNETDYQCRDVRSVPKATLKALKVECN